MLSIPSYSNFFISSSALTRLIIEYIIPPILTIEIILLITPPPKPNTVKAPLTIKFSSQSNTSVALLPSINFLKSYIVYSLRASLFSILFSVSCVMSL